ncbi:acyl-CoA dehydrogenase family protein [Paeniglutamicibacter antarcticus]|uniref:Acyl-CoA dehydrogenase family protein n=2 Tax=Paeniglutamicibacter antarcticus TaxID=494023 RepID=A0ABP9TK92_9MICC
MPLSENHATSTEAGPLQDAGELPFPDVDLMHVWHLVEPDERQRLSGIRAFLQERVRPESIDYWNREEFPRHLLPEMAAYGLGALQLDGSSELFKGLVYVEAARADASLSALVGIHNELIIGMILELGSVEQQEKWLPGLTQFTALGAFALTEPDHGSDIAGGLSTTATREGDEWVINGAKRWIGAATVADFSLVWARDTDDDAIKAFIVESTRPGFNATKISNKVGLRIMQNADISLDDVRVPEANRLPGANNFAAANELLKHSRAWVGWQAAGVQLGIFDVARDYALARRQFGRPIAAFQLVQLPLAEILGNAMASLSLMSDLARIQESGDLEMVQAAMAKSTTTRLARESAAKGRALLGGNGVSSDYEMAKLFGDAEILYTYEGTYEINSLIVGRAVTGVSAFVG